MVGETHGGRTAREPCHGGPPVRVCGRYGPAAGADKSADRRIYLPFTVTAHRAPTTRHSCDRGDRTGPKCPPWPASAAFQRSSAETHTTGWAGSVMSTARDRLEVAAAP